MRACRIRRVENRWPGAMTQIINNFRRRAYNWLKSCETEHPPKDEQCFAILYGEYVYAFELLQKCKNVSPLTLTFIAE